MPAGYTIVTANSLVQAAKTAGALDQYNRRPIECCLASAVLRKKFSENFKRDMPIRLLGDLNEGNLAVPEKEIWELSDRVLHKYPYSLAEIAALLEMTPEQTAKAYCRRRDGSLFAEPADGFKLRQRYRHVITEARRVERSFKELGKKNIFEFGRLMCQSHESCRDLFEISCAELDRLVEISMEAGALGARLTGAGFGGCTISLLEDDKVEGFINRVKQAYYRDFLKCEKQGFSSIIFPCKAVNGAGVLF